MWKYLLIVEACSFPAFSLRRRNRLAHQSGIPGSVPRGSGKQRPRIGVFKLTISAFTALSSGRLVVPKEAVANG